MTSGLSLALYLNSLVYHRNIFGSSSEVFGNHRKSSDIFGNFWKFSKNVRERSSGIRNNFGKSSKIFGRWSEICGKSSKTPSSACLYNKKNITRRLEDMNFIFSWQKQYFTHSLRSFVKYCHSKIKFISSRHRVISSIYLRSLFVFFLRISVFKFISQQQKTGTKTESCGNSLKLELSE